MIKSYIRSDQSCLNQSTFALFYSSRAFVSIDVSRMLTVKSAIKFDG